MNKPVRNSGPAHPSAGFARSWQTARAALARMQVMQIPATPQNFAIWFEYFNKNAPELNRAIDKHLFDRKQFTPDLSEQLYDRFLSADADAAAIRETSTALLDQLEGVMDYLGEAEDDTAQYNDALHEFSGRVAKAEGTDSLRAVISGVIEETREMQARTRQLESELKSSAVQVQGLRQDLERTRLEANTDALTGIPNRKSFERSMRDLAAAAAEERSALCLVFGDVDYFKQFNDNWGHQLGDQVLKLVAETLRANLKGQDIAARYGGEEFAILLPNTALEHAVRLIDRIRQVVHAKELVKKSSGEAVGHVSLSFGVAQLAPGERLSDLVQRADEALYMAKKTGRNRVVSEAEVADRTTFKS